MTKLTNKHRVHRHKIDFITNHFYYHYKSRHPESRFTRKQYTSILKMFFELVKSKIINEMFRFKFPGIGQFYLVKRKQESRINKEGKLVIDARINWPATKEIWAKTGDTTKRIRYLNEHTFGFLYKILWNKKTNHFINKKFYSFIPSRSFKQQLSKNLLKADKPLDAYIDESYFKLSEL